jgi:cell division protein ZapA
MGQVTLTIAGRAHDISCRDGEEAHLLALGKIVEQQIAQLTDQIGAMSEGRALLLTALTLADEAQEARRTAQPSGISAGPEMIQAIEQLGDRLARLAEGLEQVTANA